MRWGFIGFGRIARKFLSSLRHVPEARVTGIATRSKADDAKALCPQAQVYQSYEDLAKANDVDVVYINTTHNFHITQVLLCIDHGKHVLCEKPMGLNARDINQIIDRKANVLIMEAMWMKFLPAYRHMRALIDQGTIGNISMVKADFAFRSDSAPTGRLLNPDLAGGAMYDIGIYPLTLALDVYGYEIPTSLTAFASVAETGVDQSITYSLHYERGSGAQMYVSLAHASPCDAIVLGDKGYIQLPLFWKGQEVKLVLGNEEQKWHLPYVDTGYYHEIVHMYECIKSGLTESPLMPLSQSLLCASLMDQYLKKVL